MMPTWSLPRHKMPASNDQGGIYIQRDRQTLAPCCSLLRKRKNFHRRLEHASLCILLARSGPHIHSCTKHWQVGVGLLLTSSDSSLHERPVLQQCIAATL